MYLKSVEINNFRPFYGNNIFEFSFENLNLISGKNGTGKSALIDAIYWCLYGLEISGEHSLPIYNYNAINRADVNDEVIVNVICIFVEDDNTFKVRRELHFIKNDDLDIISFQPKSIWDVFCINHLSEHEFIEPVLFIEKHIPKSLFPFLFFDDEYVNRFFEGYSQYSMTNIKNIFHEFNEMDIIDKTNHHINHLLKQYTKELRFEDTQKYYLDLLERHDMLKKELCKIQYEIERLSHTYYDLSSKESELKINLINHPVVEGYDVKNIIKDRDALLIEIDYLKRKIEEVDNANLKLIFKQFPIALGLSTIDKEYNYNDLENILLKNADFKNTRFYEGYFNIRRLFDYRAADEIKAIHKELLNLHKAFEDKSMRLEESNAIIKNIDDSEFRKLSSNLELIEGQQADINRQLTVLNREKNRLNKDLSKIHREIERFNNFTIPPSKEKKIKFCHSAMEFGELLIQQYNKNLLYEFSNIINHIFIDIFEMNNKFKKINVEELFDISLINTYNQNISINDLSLSEKKLLKLSLIFSIYHCLELEYPIILMDPFNNLDAEKKNNVLSIIFNNQFGNQILLIMNENQYGESIKDSLFKNNVIGYNLKNHNGNTEVVYYG